MEIKVTGCHGYSAQNKGLTSVPQDIPSDVTTVTLSSNRITNVTSGIFSHLNICIKLYLNLNKISLIEPGAFAGLVFLEELYLEDNHISQQIESNMWNGLQYPEYLGLTNNYITAISPEAFSGMMWLKTLYLGKNYLTEIHANMWTGLKFLESLSWDGNLPTEVPRNSISNMPVLEKLWLSDMQLRTLRADAFQPDINEYPHQLNLQLYGNPLQCDLRLCWLKEAVTTGSVLLVAQCSNLGGAALQDIELNCTSGKFGSEPGLYQCIFSLIKYFLSLRL